MGALATRLPGLLAAVNACGLLLVADAQSSAASASSGFTFNWTSTQASPQPWRPGLVNDWDLILHDSDVMTGRRFPAATAQHGVDCAPYPDTHPVSAIDDAAFLCNNHLMTVTATGGYAEQVLTPAQLADWSQATVSIVFSVSTLRTTTRDWLTVDVTPFGENLVTPADTDVDLEGQARDHIDCNMSSSPPSVWSCYVRNGFVRRDLPSNHTRSVEEVLAARQQVASATKRTRYELDISSTHLRFGMPDYGAWFVDTDATVSFSSGVVQLQHHAYDSGKQCQAGSPWPFISCVNNTWHWSDVSISNAVPFTMIRPFELGNAPIGGGTSIPTISLAARAPPDSFLRFAGSGDFIWFSVDEGRTWARAVEQPASLINHSNDKSYFMPIPQGTTSVLFKGKDWAGGPWLVQDPSVWSLRQLDEPGANSDIAQAQRNAVASPSSARRPGVNAGQSQFTAAWAPLAVRLGHLHLIRPQLTLALGMAVVLALMVGGRLVIRLNRRRRSTR